MITCLSIRQPWAWLIAHGYKDIENRDWRCQFRGRFYIHAAKGMTRAEYDACKLFTLKISRRTTLIGFPAFHTLERGFIIGRADLVGCVEESNSPWFVGRYGFVIANPIVISPAIEQRGALGFFEAPIKDLC